MTRVERQPDVAAEATGAAPTGAAPTGAAPAEPEATGAAPTEPGAGCPPRPGRPRGLGLRQLSRDPVLNEAARRDFTRTWRRFAGVFLAFLVQPLVGLWQHDAWPGRILGVAHWIRPGVAAACDQWLPAALGR